LEFVGLIIASVAQMVEKAIHIKEECKEVRKGQLMVDANHEDCGPLSHRNEE
jgi:hypothetical protein